MNLCTSDFIEMYEIVGVLLKIIKVSIPLVIIGMGTFDLAQAVIKNEENILKKKVNILIKRIIAGILIFFLPKILLFIFDSVDFEQGELSCAYECILDTNKCEASDGTNENNSNKDREVMEECTDGYEACVSYAIYNE